MLILSLKEGHDGAIAAVKDGKLLFSLEAEKDSFSRYSTLTAETFAVAADRLDEQPDVIAVSGWIKGTQATDQPSRAGYFGVGESSITDEAGRFFGKNVRVFSSTHERSHIMTSYGMSAFPQDQAFYSLVWEGNIGSFYRIDEYGRVTHLQEVLNYPGNKYSYGFALADPEYSPHEEFVRFQDAGKQMALSGFADARPAGRAEQEAIDFILGQREVITGSLKNRMADSPFHNIGVETQAYKNFAAHLSDAIFNRFHTYAREHLVEGLPLLISGGCGLNCEWNRRWRECGLFPAVFVPPCPNDSGSAIGTAIDAQHFYTGSAALDWDVYTGGEFVEDLPFDPRRYEIRPVSHDEVARYLRDGNIIGWARGRWEIGPRALGNRSILAAPFTEETTRRLNKIKQRESYRPIAPICLEQDAGRWFGGGVPDPYMLYFSQVESDELRAVTHVDGTARTQTVDPTANPEMAELLTRFGELTGFSVLCNTSLNYSGRGFINRTSDLIAYGELHGLDGYVVNGTFITPRQ
ncbi:carbamoyltransferase C-terminal domain-containing protein [Streptomyces sp. SID8352]|uniref:carbamoyltransferase C-terminal domain-containing protein n=1 Tax=Streptomyces sp. SID8352 TaxID=2690338 RepID=UPI0013711619|nr:carbamoyltransferase C-terminal domain-containing protein [Streptomyces sp. SID8352]MYU25221.1 proline dehydrogenase [Streptomyces sp. SID8352]